MKDLLDDIVLSPDPRLSQECEEVKEITPEIKQLAKRMLDDMYAASGCGLAAPQVGETIQMIVVDCDYTGKRDRNPYVLINPKIITADGELRETGEGCLSFPGICVPVKRPSHVVVQALNLDGDLMQYEAEGNLMAVCLQHEIDHIHGVTMIDHLNPTDRAKFLAEYHEALEKGARPGEVEVD